MSFLRVVDFLDAPEVLDAGVTPIPGSGSAPLQVVSALSTISWSGVNKIRSVGTISAYVGIYSGAEGVEVLRAIVTGVGVEEIEVQFNRGDRVSIRAEGVDPIATGTLCLQFLGFA